MWTLPVVQKMSSGKTLEGNFPLKHYSASAMILFSTNPYLFYIKYVKREVFDTTLGITAVIGRAFHQAMEVYYGGSDTLIPTNESEAIQFGLQAGLEYIKQYNDGFIKYSDTIENKQKAYDLLSFIYNSYIKEIPYVPNEIVSLEEEICEFVDIEYKGQKLVLPVKLKGRIDKIIRKDGKLKIVDYKTCKSYSDEDKIDGKKIIQAIEYYLLAYAKYGEKPYSMVYQEVKYSKNKDNSKQVKEYEVVYEKNQLYFDFYFRFYEDMTRALNGEMVYVPNFDTFYDNEIGIVAYIHKLDVDEEMAKLYKKHKVSNLTDLLKKEIQKSSSMKQLLLKVGKEFVSAKNIDYSKMNTEDKIKTKLMEHGMLLDFADKIDGSSVDLYRYMPSIGLKMSRIKNYVDDIEQVLGTSGVRVLAPIRGTSYVGFEVPRIDRVFPKMPETTKGFKLNIGQTINGEARVFDIREAPHMLVAGSSGSGKSVFLHSMIQQLMKLPNVEIHCFDPKQVEFFQYEESIKEYRHSKDGIASALEHLVSVMEKRYTQMKKDGLKTITGVGNMPYKVIVIDEYADLKMKPEIDSNIKLLAAKGRACGIHLIVATQRASTKIIDGDTKSNFPVKVVFRMSKAIDSMVMLDESGAEKLLGKGDCLFAGEWGIERLQTYNPN
jgi:DNA segregation ATPase FtsK/SpoIIIE-like protein